MIGAVFFDLFETLVTEAGVRVPRASSLGARLGIDPDAYRAEWRRRRPEVVLGRLSFRNALAETAAALGGVIAGSALDAACADRAAAKAAVLRTIDPAVIETLESLRGLGIKLGVVSNCFAEDVAGWAVSPLAALFDWTTFSFAERLAKPDTRIYRAACRGLGVEPGESLFVGDGADEVAGAKDAGLRAHRALWFRSAGREDDHAPFPGLGSIRDVLALAYAEKLP